MIKFKYSKIFAQFAWVFSSTILNKVFLLIFSIVAVKTFPIEVFGKYQFVRSISSLFLIFTIPGLTKGLIQSFSRNYDKSFFKVLKVIFLTSFIASLFALLITVNFVNDDHLRNSFIIIFILFPFAYGLNLWKSFFIGKSKFRQHSTLLNLSEITKFSLMSFFLLKISTNLEDIVFIDCFCSALLNIFMTYYVYKRIDPSTYYEDGLLIYGTRRTLIESTNEIGNQISKVLIYAFISPSNLAIYSLAVNISESIKIIIQSIRQVLISKFATIKDFTTKIKKSLRNLSYLIGIFILIICFIGLPVFIKFFGEEYLSSLLYCQILTLSLLISLKDQINVSFLYARFDIKAIKNINLKSNLIRIISSIILIQPFGIFGAIISTIFYRISISLTIKDSISKYDL